MKESADKNVNGLQERTLPRHASDSDSLGFFGSPETAMIGYVEEVNGVDALEVAEFVPTREEVTQLAKFWYEQAFDYEYERFLTAQYCSRSSRLRAFAYRRLARIEETRGRASVDKAISEVQGKFGAAEKPSLLRMFLSDNEPTRDCYGFAQVPEGDSSAQLCGAMTEGEDA
jgi:hypothetical protein